MPAFLLLALFLGLAGCGDSTISRVSGKVSVDGNLVPEGAIGFYPVDGKSQTTGGMIKDGEYSVLVPVGEMTVQINAPKVIGKKKLYDVPGSKEYEIKAESLPARYNAESELKLEVTPGKVEKDWDLKTK